MALTSRPTGHLAWLLCGEALSGVAVSKNLGQRRGADGRTREPSMREMGLRLGKKGEGGPTRVEQRGVGVRGAWRTSRD
jgi:hypothetical protein